MRYNYIDGGSPLSGSIGSGQLASGSVQGFFGTVPNIASGTVGVTDFGSGAVVAGTVGSGAIVSGNVGSGQIGTAHAASGYPAAWNSDFLPAGETISGFSAVCLLSGGFSLGLAMAGSGLRLPAIGIVASNYLSGVSAQYFWQGKIGVNSGLDAGWSGIISRHLYVGSGGRVVNFSGVQTSGMSCQRVGVGLSGGVQISIQLGITSGVVATPAGTY